MTAKSLMPALLALGLASPVLAQEPSILVQSTTSTANSGLYDHLLPIFTKESGIIDRVTTVTPAGQRYFLNRYAAPAPNSLKA